MSRVRFISDLHLGHQAICKFSGEFRGGCTTTDEHDLWLVEQWNSVVTKNDLVYVLGDVCFDKAKLHLLKKMKGSKHLILGNHDKFSLEVYAQYFNKIHGFDKYKNKAWLSHSPIHPNELRGKWNVHGHVHQNIVDDLRYISVCVEAVSGKPISWDDLLILMEERKCLMKLNPQKYPPTVSNITGALTAETQESSSLQDTSSSAVKLVTTTD